jgi:phosphatidylinositol dimannoside acyltransferase
MITRRVSEPALAAAYRLGWAATKRLPEGMAQAMFEQLGTWIYHRGTASVGRLRGNLSRAAPGTPSDELDELTHQAVRSYLRYWCETFRLPVWSHEEVVLRVRTVDEHYLRDVYGAGKGAIVPLPHTANWDHAGAWACLTGMPLTTVAERLEPERLFNQFVSYRESLGMEVLALSGEAGVFSTMIDRLRCGRLVCLVADRDLSATGIEVNLLGEPARLPRGPASLSRLTGAPLVPATLSYEPAKLVVQFYPPIDVRKGRQGVETMTQELANAFSAGIRAHPVDWHMMQRVFVSDLVNS